MSILIDTASFQMFSDPNVKIGHSGNKTFFNLDKVDGTNDYVLRMSREEQDLTELSRKLNVLLAKRSILLAEVDPSSVREGSSGRRYNNLSKSADAAGPDDETLKHHKANLGKALQEFNVKVHKARDGWCRFSLLKKTLCDELPSPLEFYKDGETKCAIKGVKYGLPLFERMIVTVGATYNNDKPSGPICERLKCVARVIASVVLLALSPLLVFWGMYKLREHKHMSTCAKVDDYATTFVLFPVACACAVVKNLLGIIKPSLVLKYV